MASRCGRGLAVLGLLGLLAPGLNSGAAARPLQPGTEVFAVAPEKVLEISYRTAVSWLVAHRWQVGDRFTLILLKPGQPLPDSCLAGEGFQTVLRQLTSLKLRQTPSANEAEALLRKHPLPTWGELMIRDDSPLEPFRARVLPVAGTPEEVWLHFHGATYRVALNQEVLERLAKGCRALADAGSQTE